MSAAYANRKPIAPIHVNNCYKLIISKLLKQGYWYHKLCKTFSKFYCQYFESISLKFYSDLLNKLFKLIRFLLSLMFFFRTTKKIDNPL